MSKCSSPAHLRLESAYALAYHKINYSLIAFDKRVTFGFNASGHCLVHMHLWHYFHMRHAYNHYAIAHAYNAANKHMQGSDQAR